MNNIEKGFLYEKQIKNFIINNTNFNAYLWNECPETILIDNKLISSHKQNCIIRKEIKEGKLNNYKDIGIDIIQIDNNNICNGIIQCKNGYLNGICISDISGIMIRSAFNKTLPTFIYYTNSLSKNINHLISLNPNVLSLDFSELKNINYYENNIYFIKQPFNYNEKDINIINKIIYTPYEYQIEAVNKIKENFKKNNRSIISIPCGCGKTYISYLLSLNYNHIIIISPLKEFALQNLNRYIDYGYNKTDTILIDSDGIRDIEIIKNKIKNKKLLISSTFKSVDIISECLNLFNNENTLFILDEFHNLSKNNISNKEDNIYKLLISNYKILFMSATPRIYDIEYLKFEEDDNYNDYENNFNELFGNVVYNMTLTYAINNKFITDYKIWIPSIHENNEELKEELSIYHIDNSLKNRCIFGFSCILNNGSKKIIIYCKDTNDMNNMINSFIQLNNFYNIDIEINSISCQNTDNERKKILKNFSNNDNKIQLLFNIYILNECIDIPSCDSIYISYPPKNKITTIQRINRATRINKNNLYKIANIYIWCHEYEEILETLSSIKEYDIMFNHKIKLNIINFYNNKTKKQIKLLNKEQELLNNYIIGIKEFKNLTWKDRLLQIEDYIKKNSKLPSSTNKDKHIKYLGKWMQVQKENYKNTQRLMKNEEIRKEWEIFIQKYKELFKTNEETWKDKLLEIENYIKINSKLPQTLDNNIKSLGMWIKTQKKNYKNNQQIMKNEEIRKEWEIFIEKYKEIFKTNEETWKDNLLEIEDYIKKNSKLPSSTNKDKNIKSLGQWIIMQKQNYKNNERVMKNEEIRKEWEIFIEKYKEIFKTNEETWKDNLLEIEEYIKINYKLPSICNKDKNIKYLGQWIRNQKQNYKNNQQIMKNKEIRKEWEIFMHNYQELF